MKSRYFILIGLLILCCDVTYDNHQIDSIQSIRNEDDEHHSDDDDDEDEQEECYEDGGCNSLIHTTANKLNVLLQRIIKYIRIITYTGW